MTDFIARLKQRKLVQWAVAYVAFAFALIQGVDVVAQQFGWPEGMRRGITLALVLGFFVVLVLAWYHGERGAQRVTGTELLIITLLLAVGGGVLWRYARAPVDSATGTSTGVAAANSTRPASRALGTTSASMAASSAAQSIPAKSIAVLPFENLSSDKANAYFSDGMQDLILTKLADIGKLKVISRTSTMQYGSHPQNLKIIGEQLGVATLLEGSVQKAGNQVLVNVQLIDTRTDSHIWAQSYTRTLDNVFGVEGEVAQKVADALQAKLTPTETAQLATTMSADAAANDLFLRAEYLATRSNTDYSAAGFKAAIPLYRQATAQDPHFALAYARLSVAESAVVWFGSGEDNTGQLVADGQTHAEKALALQPNLVAGYVALGYNAYWGRQDYPSALKAFTAALKLRPNDADALAGAGYVLRRQGRFDAAIKVIQRAVALDPRNSGLATTLAETYAAIGRNAEAGQFYRRALALNPDNYQAQFDYSTLVLVSTGDVARALEAAQGHVSVLRLWRSQLLTLQRRYPEALALLADIPVGADTFTYQVGPKALMLANLHRLMGVGAQAQPLYEQALSQSRARIAALAGNADKSGFVWNHIAAAELGLGRTVDALDALAKSQALMTQSGDLYFKPGVNVVTAQLYAQAGRADLAVPLLAKALASPGIDTTYSAVMLWIDPAWDPIRHDPRFEALLKNYANAKPTAASSEAKP
jgi:TolB-like protein